MNKQKGFTLVEMMVGVAMLGVMLSIALPNYTIWMAQMRVDDEITQLHRLMLTGRNMAVNMEQPVVICPLDGSNSCVNNWTNEISVFVDADNNGRFDPAVNDTLIRVKERINAGDNLTFQATNVTYQPTGQSGGAQGTFRYCPRNQPDMNRAIRVSLRGRVYVSSDINNDGKDELRDGTSISC